jgi:hypothetical protein
MTGTVRRLKVNRRYTASACAWCGDALSLGEDGAVCEACEGVHHALCWNEHNGCGQADCVNAPLRQVAAPALLEEQLSAGEMRCLHCRKLLRAGTVKCSGCQRYTTPSGLYEGERKTDGEARDAFWLGLIALVIPPVLNALFIASDFKLTGIANWIPLIIGVRCGWSAIKKGRAAKSRVANNQTLKGAGLATAGQILGGTALALPVLSIVILVLVIVNGGA